VATALVVSLAVIVLVAVIIVGIYKIKPKRFRASASVTKWCSFNIEVEEPQTGHVRGSGRGKHAVGR
jgi:hypothetical protein